MSLKVSGERLLAEALADAMDRDLADVPSGEQLERQHRFSGKFVRRMKRLETAVKEGREVTDAAEPPGAPGKRVADDRRGAALQNRSERNRKWGALARQYGALAAVFVCVIGLVAVVGVMGRMGASGTKENITGDQTAADTAAPEEMEDAVSEDSDMTESAANGAADDAMDEAMDDAASDEGEASDAGQPEDEQEITAPGWQEQLLAESQKADQLVRWHLNTLSDDGSISLHSEVVSPGEGAVDKAFFVTAVYEVYFEQGSDDWVCVYRTKRTRAGCSEEMSWDEWYAPVDLNMTQAGTYRLVRQVDSCRQVLQLTLDGR